MSLIIDCIRPSQPSAASLPQLQVDLKDALYSTPTPTRMIVALSANIMEAAEVCTIFADSRIAKRLSIGS